MATTRSMGSGRLSSVGRLALWGGAATVLLLPLIAMRFTGEVNWDGADFAIFGIMLAGLCAGIEVAVRFGSSSVMRILGVMAALSAFLLVWIELAVGIFD